MRYSLHGNNEDSRRSLDIIFSFLGLLMLLPLFVLVSILIKMESKGTVLFTQIRIGKNFKPFNLYKFRSMVTDAAKIGPPMTYTENDTRITKTGRFLRMTKIDELPQLFNVLKGDMSFVGPRPERPELVTKFRKEIANYDARHAVRPGLTGMAQIYGRYDSSPRHKFYYEVLYIKKQSLWLDIRLILVSFGITFMGRWEDRVQKLPRWLGHGQWRRLSLAGMNPHAGKKLHPPTGQKGSPKSLM